MQTSSKPTRDQSRPPIHLILFDLGGVLVELTGVPIFLTWLENRMTPDELWAMWLRSPAVRSFETGRSTAETFADELIRDLGLPVDREKFLREFVAWPKGLFPGALDVVRSISGQYKRATLSNTNTLHWPRLMGEMQLADAFDHHFASHQIGKIKPDDEIFHHVIDAVGCQASEILFLDDNQLNVEAALRLGIQAVRVYGVQEAERVLIEVGVVENS